jgi:glutamate/aspartate transport system substrate-binding protein
MRSTSIRPSRPRPDRDLVARAFELLLLACALAFAAFTVHAEDGAPELLSGTLAKARSTGVVAVAYRESSVPFSFVNARGEPVGYSIELCRQLVDAMSEAVGRELAIEWVKVTSESRIEAIVSKHADLECGSTTNNLERAKQVAFSPTIFISGTKLLVKRGSPIRSFKDLAGRTVVVTAGTTNEQAMRKIASRFHLDIRIVAERDHEASFAQLAAGKADAFATDDVLLYGLVAQHKARAQYQVVGDFLSYDPYGIMFRKGDAQMLRVVVDTFRRLAEDGEVERQYNRWFLGKLPSGERLDMPMSAQLESVLDAMAVRPE